MTQDEKPHSLFLENRSKLTITGVREIAGFEQTGAIIHTELGSLILEGQGLELKELSGDGGKAVICGRFEALSYRELPGPGFFGKLFKA